MKGIILKQDEVRTLQSEGKVTVWRDVKTKKTRKPFTGGMLGYAHVKDHLTTGLKNGAIKCPYATPGKVLFVKEPYWPTPTNWHSTEAVLYQNDYTDQFVREVRVMNGESVSWRASTAMPEWAARYRVLCQTVTVEKRGDVWQWGISLEKVTA